MVGNKVDLLPKGVSLTRVTEWIRAIARGHRIDAVDVRLISSITKAGVQELANEIEYHRQVRTRFLTFEMLTN